MKGNIKMFGSESQLLQDHNILAVKIVAGVGELQINYGVK